MDLAMSINLDGMSRKFGALVAACADPQDALLRCAGRVRANARKAFDQQGPGWAPLDEETAKRKITAAEVSLLSEKVKGRKTSSRILSLARRREKMWATDEGTLKPSARARFEQRFTAMEAETEVYELAYNGARTGSFDAIVRFLEADRRRAQYHGEQLKIARAAHKAGEIDDAEKRRIAARGKRRYLAQGNADRMLGNLDKSISIVLDVRRVRIFSHARIGGIHNVGGTAGNGAKIPARPFMYLRNSDAEIFAAIVAEEMAGAFMAAA